GPGNDPQLLPHLYERFVRADRSRTRQTGIYGLGLAKVATIVETHGGTNDATSGSGTTAFRVRLPTAAVGAAQPVSA
ncbi:MAG: ATP-binding protein, partial [Mycolicibacterium sp.]